ncbi:glutaminyl-peptide cyclotransferase [Drosophila eugracilis]|uniref:glutaminyl-peptide cyclotransferase n=1 Tax=Drosophila eugracilis TaxID=29029 RepID=UPI0007E71545|nr:glutaminyl-peptide cyclotransferase [Drosophila eugracilis]
MFGRIAFFLTVVYMVFNITLLRWAAEKQPFIFFEDEEYFNETLWKLLKPRYVGSQGHSEVSDFIEKELQYLGFNTIRYDFHEGASFTNLVGFWNMEAEHFLVLTCHYDSKMPKDLNKEKEFHSATEGAVSCAILLNVAKNLQQYLGEQVAKKSDMGLALIFFDGHNSVTSKDEDRLTGVRHFIETDVIPLQNIGVVLTLSYIGAPNQIFMSYFESTNDLHHLLTDIEKELRKSGQLTDCHVLFHNEKRYDHDILDDHILFSELGVAVLHLAPQELPKVLYTAADNVDNLHYPTIRNMIKIIRKLVYDFLEQWDSYANMKDTFSAYYDLDDY